MGIVQANLTWKVIPDFSAQNAANNDVACRLKAVLDYFRLTPEGSDYVWDPTLEYKNNPCCGPGLSRPSAQHDPSEADAFTGKWC
jgi:hypothetical protein